MCKCALAIRSRIRHALATAQPHLLIRSSPRLCPQIRLRHKKIQLFKAQRGSSSRRAGQNWLARHRRSRRRRTGLLPLTARATHLSEWSAFPTSHRERSTHRDGRSHRSPQGNRRAKRDRGAHWDRRSHRNRGARRDRRNYGNRPGQSHRHTRHVRERSAGRSARARCRSCSGGLARRRLEACVVAAGYQRGGRRLRAQRQSDAAQSSACRNYGDVESIKDRHRRRTLHLRSDIVMRQRRMPYQGRRWTTASIISSHRCPTGHAAPTVSKW